MKTFNSLWKKVSKIIFIPLMVVNVYGAKSSSLQIFSSVESTGSSIGQDVVSILGTFGLIIAVIGILGIILGLLISPDRIKEHIKAILITILAGGVVKMLSSMSIGTIF